jgi:hypothetical protein
MIAILVIAAAFLIAILSLNTRTSFGQQNSAQPTDSIAMTIYLRPHENKYLFYGNSYYRINTGSMTASKGSTLCPSGTCHYSIENSLFYPNAYTNGYVLGRLLKVSAVSNGATSSMFYPTRADLDKIAAQEGNGQTIEFLKGTIGFGADFHFMSRYLC